MNTLRYIYLIDHNNSVHANLRNMIFFFYRNDSQRQQQSQFVQWLHRHSNIVPIILYTLLLIFVGLLSSKRFWKRFQQIYEETFDKLGWTDHSVLQYCCGQSLQQQVVYRKNELVNKQQILDMFTKRSTSGYLCSPSNCADCRNCFFCSHTFLVTFAELLSPFQFNIMLISFSSRLRFGVTNIFLITQYPKRSADS